ncbi:MAG: hypothetical protein SFV22_00820 [Saprospiraceae bacterium]|nr:hypothetical protein [Saprospiraceae bacterium]
MFESQKRSKKFKKRFETVWTKKKRPLTFATRFEKPLDKKYKRANFHWLIYKEFIDVLTAEESERDLGKDDKESD